MDKNKLIELIDNNVTYHKLPDNVGVQYPSIKEQIEFGIDQLINSVKEECAKDVIGTVFRVLIYEKSAYSKKCNKDIIDNTIKEIEEQFEMKSPKP